RMFDLRATLGELFPRAYFHLGFPSPALSPHLELGQLGESHVARRLRAAGWRILAQNALAPSGEIDLVALQGSTLVLVEVKSGLWPIGRRERDPRTQRWRPGHRFQYEQFETYRRALPQMRARLPQGLAHEARIDLIEVLWRHASWSPAIIHHVDLRAPLPRSTPGHGGENS
ncbi:MAG: hypothetical protein ACI89E_002356, partial [Planctomycetota bacterium]